MKPQSGFTLIEVMTVAIISTVLAGVVLSLIYLTSDQIKESLAHQKAISQFEIVTEQIHKVARRAFTVRSTGEAEFTAATWPPAPGAGNLTSQDGLKFYDRALVAGAPNCIGGFEFQSVPGGLFILEEWKNGAFEPFKIGDDSVFVVPSLKFTRNAARQVASFEIYILYRVNGIARTLKTPAEIAHLRGN